MSTSKHTPGPFEVQDPMGSDVGFYIVQAGLLAHEWSCIAIVPRDEDRHGKHFITKAEQKANAALFAAAPDMLAALKGMDAYWTEDFPAGPDGPRTVTNGFGEVSEDTMTVWRNVRAAIAKAEGRP